MSDAAQVLPERPLWPAVRNGLRCRCPRCGEGKLFARYLKVKPVCEHCGEELFHHRADDLPPYISIVIVGHLLVGVMMHMEMAGSANPLMYWAILVPLAVILPLVMLPSIKGGVVGFQWAKYMHGFNPRNREDVKDFLTH